MSCWRGIAVSPFGLTNFLRQYAHGPARRLLHYLFEAR